MMPPPPPKVMSYDGALQVERQPASTWVGRKGVAASGRMVAIEMMHANGLPDRAADRYLAAVAEPAIQCETKG